MGLASFGPCVDIWCHNHVAYEVAQCPVATHWNHLLELSIPQETPVAHPTSCSLGEAHLRACGLLPWAGLSHTAVLLPGLRGCAGFVLFGPIVQEVSFSLFTWWGRNQRERTEKGNVQGPLRPRSGTRTVPSASFYWPERVPEPAQILGCRHRLCVSRSGCRVPL